MAQFKNFHNGNGWNYGFKKVGKKVQPYRYHTNGHQNGTKEYAPELVEMEQIPTTPKDAESLFHAPGNWGKREHLPNIGIVRKAAI